jgi:hypothetical protein
MKKSAGTAFVQFSLLLAFGCGPDAGMITPATHGDGTEPSLASERFSDWSSPDNLGETVNSAALEQHPSLSKNGLTLYFASNRSGDQDIWVAQRDCLDCSWNTPRPVASVNSLHLDASPALSRDEHQLFFISQRGEVPRWPGDTCAAAPCDRDLWVSYREDVHNDFGWQAAVNLGRGPNSNGEEVAPSYFENNDTGFPQLFFNDGIASGAMVVRGDIYVSELSPEGTWGPRSEVNGVNTREFSDQRPSISHDGLTLYFHSTRPMIPGGLSGVAHIWVATRPGVSDPWSAPTLWPTPTSDEPALQPFISSHGRTETLLFMRGGDIWISERTRGNESN